MSDKPFFTYEDAFMLMNPNKPNDKPWRVIMLDNANAKVGPLLEKLKTKDEVRDILENKNIELVEEIKRLKKDVDYAEARCGDSRTANKALRALLGRATSYLTCCCNAEYNCAGCNLGKEIDAALGEK